MGYDLLLIIWCHITEKYMTYIDILYVINNIIYLFNIPLKIFFLLINKIINKINNLFFLKFSFLNFFSFN